MDWFFYAVALPFTLLFLASAAYALHWAVKNGQFKEFEKNATTIFDDEEPVGRPTDYYPGRRQADQPRR